MFEVTCMQGIVIHVSDIILYSTMSSRNGGENDEVDPLAVTSSIQSVGMPAKNMFAQPVHNFGKSDITQVKDQLSSMGRFGWCEIAGIFLPVIFRSCNETFLSVRMVEKALLGKLLLTLPREVFTCAVINSFKVTEAECKLLNDINLVHCDSNFGKVKFSVEDLLVKKDDVAKLISFLDLCHRKMILKKSTEKDRCGFIRIGGTSDVPYTQVEGVKFLPSFYFEGELDTSKCVSLSGWDWAHLRFCCKVQGVKDELIVDDKCQAVDLQELRLYFAPGTTFAEYWPSKDFISRVPSKKMSRMGIWTKVITNHEGYKFNGKLVLIKEFPLQQFSKDPPYKAMKCRIENKVIQCMNIRPYQYNEVMVTLPHMVEQLFSGNTEEQVGNMMLSQDTRLFKGNSGHLEVIKQEGWEDKYVNLPLVIVKDILSNIQSWKKLKVIEVGKRSKGI